MKGIIITTALVTGISSKGAGGWQAGKCSGGDILQKYIVKDKEGKDTVIDVETAKWSCVGHCEEH